jgi:hypothetical protein
VTPTLPTANFETTATFVEKMFGNHMAFQNVFAGPNYVFYFHFLTLFNDLNVLENLNAVKKTKLKFFFF